ncbi:MAG: hypothetical protein WA896_04335 [Spirulinaceae cyanobacterium]
MAIIALKAWYIEDYEPIKQVIQRPHDLRLSRNSLLKSGLRADFLNDTQEVRNSDWFERYLEGEEIEFYVEGSGGYAISNIDLISQEIYFTKQDLSATLEPIIYFSCQKEYPDSSTMLRENLIAALDDFNERSRLPLTLEESLFPTEGPVRLSSSQLRKIRKSLLFVADGTIVTKGGEDKQQLIPSPNVCVEIGYAIHSKKSGQVLLTRQKRPEFSGNYPFDLPNRQQLTFQDSQELSKTLPTTLESLLKRFNLFN